MIDLIKTIKIHTESSKSELSSGIFGHVKVWLKFVFCLPWGFTIIDVLRVGGLLLLGLTIGNPHYRVKRNFFESKGNSSSQRVINGISEYIPPSPCKLAAPDSLRSTRFARLASLDSLRSTRFASIQKRHGPSCPLQSMGRTPLIQIIAMES